MGRKSHGRGLCRKLGIAVECHAHPCAEILSSSHTVHAPWLDSLHRQQHVVTNISKERQIAYCFVEILHRSKQTRMPADPSFQIGRWRSDADARYGTQSELRLKRSSQRPHCRVINKE